MEKLEEIFNKIDAHQKRQTKKIVKRYLSKWPWFVLLSFVGILMGVLIFKFTPERFEVKSRILAKGEDPELSSVLSFNNPVMSAPRQANIDNTIGILQSHTLFRKALINLKWDASWFQKKLFYRKDLYKNVPFELEIPSNEYNTQNVPVKIIKLNDREFKVIAKGKTEKNGELQSIDIEDVVEFGVPFYNEFFHFILLDGNDKTGEKYFLNFNNLNLMSNQYLKKTKISHLDLNSDLITISIKGRNVQKETDFINELNNVFIGFGLENEKTNSDKSLEFIDLQLATIKTKLKSAEENFSNYRSNKQTINLSQEAQILYQKMEKLEEEKYMTQLQIDYYKDLLESLDDSKKISDLAYPSVVGITNTGLNDMLSKLMDLYRRKEIISYSVQEKNPSLQILEKEIKITRDALEETVRNQLKITESVLESSEQRYASMKNRVTQLPETEKELIGVQREFDLNNELYTYLMQKRAEASILKASIASEIQVIDPAMAEAAEQVGPNLLVDAGVGFTGGLLITFIFITFLGYFNSKIESKEEIEETSSILVFDGVIAHKYKEKLPTVYYPRSGIAESFMGVKSNINTLLEESGSGIISVNSLIPGEGKSFISSNLAAVLAAVNKKTLLIGADLHNPALHKYIEIQEAEGLSDYLTGTKDISEVIKTTSIPSLDFIQAGAENHKPSDLLNNSRLKLLIETVRKNYDYIVIDNAPLLLVPDAIITSRISDISLFIIRINYSRKQQIQQIQKIVDFNKIKHVALLINSAPYNGYGYGYKYYKKGYGESRFKASIA